MPNDDSLLHELHKDYAAAWTALYKHYRNELLPYCMQLTGDNPVAEEIANDCIEKASRRREQFSGNEHVRRFLITCAKNACTDIFRKKVSQQKSQKALLENANEYEEHAFHDKEPEWQDLMQAVLEAIQDLPKRQQEAFRLHYLFDTKHEDVTKIMGIKQSTAYNLVNIALKNLRERFGTTTDLFSHK